MKTTIRYSFVFGFIVTIIFFSSCNNAPKKEKTIDQKDENKKQGLSKPPSSYQDTLKIDVASAVFYHPDSLQLQKIKELTDERIFEGQMHEFFSQMRNARLVLKNDWESIKIIEAKNVRFLLFIRKENDTALIDLNEKNDPHGLFLFMPAKEPHLADMMNIDTELSFYFSK